MSVIHPPSSPYQLLGRRLKEFLIAGTAIKASGWLFANFGGGAKCKDLYPPPKKKKGPTQLCDIQWNTWDWLWLQHPGDVYVKPIKLIWKFGFELLDLIKCHKDALPESRSAIITHLEVGEEGSTLEVCFMFRIYSITSIKEVYYPYPTTNDTKWQPENSQQVNNQRIS